MSHNLVIDMGETNVINPYQKMFVGTFYIGLNIWHFNKSLTRKPVNSMEEIVARAKCYVKWKYSNVEKMSIDAKDINRRGFESFVIRKNPSRNQLEKGNF